MTLLKLIEDDLPNKSNKYSYRSFTEASILFRLREKKDSPAE